VLEPCRWPLYLLTAAALFASACHRARPAPSYSQRVAPIVARRCLPCHASTPGSAAVAPALDSPVAAQRVAAQLALAVERRSMPPWGADGSGACGRFIDAAWLEDREIDTLRAWASGGAPLGSGASPTPSLPAADVSGPFAWLFEPAPGERRLSLATQFTPAPGSSATRCFQSDVALDGDWSIGALAVHAEPALGVQQLGLYALAQASQLAAVKRLEDEDAEPGWNCPGGNRLEGSELLASWSWLNPLQRLPAGSALHATAGLPFVLQVRYNLHGAGPQPSAVRASAELMLRPPPEHAARLLPLAPPELRLPGGQRRVEVLQELPLSERSALLGVVPQLHELGRSVLLERERGGQRQCLASFAHWTPAQEQLFRYRTPFDLEPGDRLRLSCTYDTTSRSGEVLGGEGIDQEQCRIYLYGGERP
jgi:hypothetical protein